MYTQETADTLDTLPPKKPSSGSDIADCRSIVRYSHITTPYLLIDTNNFVKY